MGQLGGMGNHAVMGPRVADLDPAEANLGKEVLQRLQIPRGGGLCGRQNHTGPLEELRGGPLIPGPGQSRHGMAAGVADAAGQGDGGNLRHQPLLDAHQIHHLGSPLHQRDGFAEKADGGLRVQHGNQQVALGKDRVVGDAVDGALGQGRLRHSAGAVPAVHGAAGVPLQRLGHGPAQKTQARHHNQPVRSPLGEADQLKLRGVFRVVLQILPQQVEAEGLPRVPAAEYAGVRRQSALRQMAGGNGGVLLLHPHGLRIVPGQRLLALLQRLNVGGHGADFRHGGIFDKQAVVDGDAVQRQHPVAQTPQGRLRLQHHAGHMVQRGHDAAVHRTGFEGAHHALGVNQGNVLHISPAQARRHASGGGLGVAALDALITDLHHHALTSPWSRRTPRCSWRSSGWRPRRPPR